MRGRRILEELLFDSHEIEIIITDAIRIILWTAIRRNPFRILHHHVGIVILAATDVVVVVSIVGRRRPAGPLRSINRMERTKDRFFTPFPAIS